MLKNLYILAISLLPLLVYANEIVPLAVEEALQLAGKNRSEIQKVIIHYKESGNIEKLESAYFLIKNMPGKYGLYYNEDFFYFNIFKEVDSLSQTTSCEELIDNYIFKQAEYFGVYCTTHFGVKCTTHFGAKCTTILERILYKKDFLAGRCGAIID